MSVFIANNIYIDGNTKYIYAGIHYRNKKLLWFGLELYYQKTDEISSYFLGSSDQNHCSFSQNNYLLIQKSCKKNSTFLYSYNGTILVIQFFPNLSYLETIVSSAELWNLQSHH